MIEPGDIPFVSVETPETGKFTAIDLNGLLAGRSQPLPFTLRVILENLARQALAGADTLKVMGQVANWTPGAPEIAVPLAVSRLMLPDSSGLPVLMDLAAARDVVADQGEDPSVIEPRVPITLVVDHSLIVDMAGHPNARTHNIAEEFRRNSERYSFFKWAEQAFDKLRVVPPGAGIIHQVHLERLAQVVETVALPGHGALTGPEFVLGCDSHTPMVNGLGVLAWGVGGIDGEAAALGLPYVARVPRVVGLRFSGRLAPGVLPTDLVLSITQTLRKAGVVGDFVEAFGPSLPELTVPDRATIANMAPEYGATACLFPIDAQTIAYLRQSGRDEAQVALVEAYALAVGLFAAPDAPEPAYSEVIEVDLSTIVPSVAGPKRPQDRVPLTGIKPAFRATLTRPVAEGGFGLPQDAVRKSVPVDDLAEPLRHGTIAIAAITSCTNTSNPTVMVAAGLLARNAVARGLSVPEWVKTSLAPGSRLVTDYLTEAGLIAPLEALGFHVVGYGCTTCSGKSGPIRQSIASAIEQEDLVAAAVLSGNRNFEGRIHKSVRAAYLASPPLVVGFALAGRVDVDFETDPLGSDASGAPVFLRDIWPDPAELQRLVAGSQRPERFRESYATLFDGGDIWDRLEAPTGARFAWDPDSTYILRPPFFELGTEPLPDAISGLRVLVHAGDSLTTDYVTPSGEILPDSQPGQFLIARGVEPSSFNAVTQRRGNHEFMARITFANQRMKNRLVPEREGGWTRRAPDAGIETIFDRAEVWKGEGVPAMVLAGKNYGMGSSRDWAAKGPKLLGVRAVLAESFERIHRANLIGMGILPLVFADGQNADSLGLTGFETFSITGLQDVLNTGAPVAIRAEAPGRDAIEFSGRLDLASGHEADVLQKGGLFASLLDGVSSGEQNDAW
ncbi:aconitate hydratase AcnA [Oceanibium sediminis]|uniref:aconitate hydratase AcnA n=1 Tax=Oceanibium sediminis TaxID=2026339 RepID=UPI000DD3CC10|nr:aconitate hydratase AcnA [Oceanibium sediminis]